ncbi:MAG TPA: glycosyltransferase family 39 protein [Terriglobales bacterium]|nr:glycosyltransferase family 39 protein [Terriglobales bacterium]
MSTRTASLECPPTQVLSPVSRPRRSPWLRSPAFWMVVVAFAVRIGFMLAARTYLFDAYRIDEYSYHNETTSIARSIAEGRGFSSPFSADYTGPTSWIAPVYPYLCALFFRCFGVFSTKAAIALILLQSLISALTCVPILGIAKRTVGPRAGIPAALLWAIFPWFSKWAVCWIWEISLSTLLFACLFWYALRLAEPASWKLWLGFGALWGFALLVNPALLTLLPPSLVWCAYQMRSPERAFALEPAQVWWQQWTKHALVAAAACLLVISPWLVRNRVVLGQWAFVRGNFGFEFWLGNARYATPRGWIKQHPMGNAAELQRYRTMGEPTYVRSKLREALSAVRENPSRAIHTTAQRVAYFWDGSAMGYRPQVVWYWLPWSFAWFSFLLLPSMLFAILRRVRAWPLFFAVLLLYPIPYYITYSQVRYRHVLEPLMLLLLACLLPLRQPRNEH